MKRNPKLTAALLALALAALTACSAGTQSAAPDAQSTSSAPAWARPRSRRPTRR